MAEDFFASAIADDYTPAHLNTAQASAARLYDYYLGGKDNFPVDRALAEQLYARIPELQSMARANRLFLQRVVRYLAREVGVTQFIDIGAGLPTQNPVHQIAQRHQPEARVVYVDNDPHVLTHARALLADNDQTAVITADMCHPEQIIDAPETRELIDFTRPVAILLIAVLHFVSDEDDPHAILAGLRQRLCSGSYMAVSHVESDTAPERAAHLSAEYARTTHPARLRTRTEISELFTGLETVGPGLCHVGDWRPDGSEPYFPPHEAWVYGGLARL